LRVTNGALDLAVEGGGMFQVNTPTGEIGYTRSGAFHLNGEGLLVTADGLAVEPQITIPPDALSVSISGDGIVSVIQPGQAEAAQVGTIELALFQNAAGLRALGGNLFVTTTASGEPTVSSPGIDGLGTIAQGFLEESNVSVAEEMVAMILGQRAYEANSRVLKVADEMLQNVNQMVR
jgi:flagellar basal-body rod protein FlgG